MHFQPQKSTRVQPTNLVTSRAKGWGDHGARRWPLAKPSARMVEWWGDSSTVRRRRPPASWCCGCEAAQVGAAGLGSARGAATQDGPSGTLQKQIRGADGHSVHQHNHTSAVHSAHRCGVESRKCAGRVGPLRARSAKTGQTEDTWEGGVPRSGCKCCVAEGKTDRNCCRFAFPGERANVAGGSDHKLLEREPWGCQAAGSHVAGAWSRMFRSCTMLVILVQMLHFMQPVRAQNQDFTPVFKPVFRFMESVVWECLEYEVDNPTVCKQKGLEPVFYLPEPAWTQTGLQPGETVRYTAPYFLVELLSVGSSAKSGILT
jgi:hypothetical protein